jgi:hypothetical protein
MKLLIILLLVTQVISDCSKCLEEGVSFIYGLDKQWNIITGARSCNSLSNCSRTICNTRGARNVTLVVVQTHYPC